MKNHKTDTAPESRGLPDQGEDGRPRSGAPACSASALGAGGREFEPRRSDQRLKALRRVCRKAFFLVLLLLLSRQDPHPSPSTKARLQAPSPGGRGTVGPATRRPER